MKKITAIILASLILLTFVALTACEEEADVVRITLYTTSDSAPRVVEHVIGQDDLPKVTNGNLTFSGWYYDDDREFKYSDEIAEGTALYAKWTQGGSQTENKVVLTLNPNYVGSTLSTYELTKNDKFNLPTITRTGYTFEGWFTQAADGIKWTDSMPISADTTLYAHWTSTGGNVPNPTPVDLSATLSKYGDTSNWNFAVTTTIADGSDVYEYYYEYLGDYISDKYEGTDGNTYIDYYDMSNYEVWYYYTSDENGTYYKYDDTTAEFEEAYSYSVIIDLSAISTFTFTPSGDGYAAQNASEAGNSVLGEYTGYSWTSFTLYISNGNISKIEAALNDGSAYTYEFSKYGQINFTLPNAEQGGSSNGGSGDPLPTEPTGVMDNQVYDEATFDNKNLQQKMEACEDIIGLPSTGTYNALVVPVQFKGDTITQTQLNNLNAAFNGTSAQTGWESVASYYQKSSYGNLNITFDIQDVYQANQNAAYYTSYNKQIGTGENAWKKDGSALILEEVLAYYENILDLTKYDTNSDGCIDAVYLIYSADVDYSADSFYWAYVTWYYGENQYDGLDAYYYLFAGFDFMTENLDKMNGVNINAETYIHETGHLLGLDDYYDYEENKGGNQGLGGADMMDYNVGDHGVYSKIMLGWLDPTIVTSTQTVTIKSSQAEGCAILIPLNWNNSYFCEYLLIDLYSAEGLNAMGASQQDTILYGGARYGVRIYHVTSWVNDPYNNDFGSFTDCNNSNSYIPLIKLVEADGQTSSSASGSWASESDLWQVNDTLSGAFPQYMRNDGKTLNFDIRIDSVSAESATVTVTFNAA